MDRSRHQARCALREKAGIAGHQHGADDMS